MNSKVVSFVFFLVFCVCIQAISVGSPIKAIYVDWHLNWNAPQQSVLDAIDAGYNVIIISFYLSGGTAADIAQAWAALDSSVKQSTINTAHSKGAVVLVSLGGSTDAPFDKDPTALGQQVAAWAKANYLDGVDFDLENINQGFVANGKTADQLVSWHASLAKSAYQAFGGSPIITFAPQGPYFGPIGATDGWVGASGGYTGVYKQASQYITFFNVQFYNQGAGCYSDYTSLFKNSGPACPPFPHTSVGEIAAAGVPLSKIVVGKPVTAADASNGWLSGSALAGLFNQAKSDLGWNTGVMGWVWNDATTCKGFVSAVYGGSGSNSGVSASISGTASSVAASVSTTSSATVTGSSSSSGSSVCSGNPSGMYCVGSQWQYCTGNYGLQNCGAGTVCKQSGSTIVCDFP